MRLCQPTPALQPRHSATFSAFLLYAQHRYLNVTSRLPYTFQSKKYLCQLISFSSLLKSLMYLNGQQKMLLIYWTGALRLQTECIHLMVKQSHVLGSAIARGEGGVSVCFWEVSFRHLSGNGRMNYAP